MLTIRPSMGKKVTTFQMEKMGLIKKGPLGSFGKWWVSFLYLMAIQNRWQNIILVESNPKVVKQTCEFLFFHFFSLPLSISNVYANCFHNCHCIRVFPLGEPLPHPDASTRYQVGPCRGCCAYFTRPRGQSIEEFDEQ